MAIRIFIVFSVLLIWGCSSKVDKATEDVVMSFAKKQEQHLGLSLVVSYPTLKGKIEKLNATFTMKKSVSIEEARSIILDSACNFVREINQDKNIRPFLSHYPFSENDILVGVGFLDEKENHFCDGSVAYAFLKDGKICYCECNPTTFELEDKHVERFEDVR